MADSARRLITSSSRMATVHRRARQRDGALVELIADNRAGGWRTLRREHG